jgi:hypothetical protein
VRGVLADHAQRVWVAEAGGEPIGLVAATLRQSGMLVAIIETGGGPGRTPARRSTRKPAFHRYTLEGDLVRRMVVFTDRAEATAT